VLLSGGCIGERSTARSFALDRPARSFSAAADKLGTTQPAISARVKQLERSLDRELFLRAHKILRPSAAERALLPFAEEALGILSRIQYTIVTGQTVSGVVRIGMGEIVALS